MRLISSRLRACIRITAALAAVMLVAGCASTRRDDAPLMRHDLADRVGLADPGAAAAAPVAWPDSLDADTAVRVALMHNPRMRIIWAQLQIAEAERRLAILPENPHLDGALRFPVGGGTSVLDLGVAQDVLALLQTPLRRRVADADYELAKLALSRELLEVVMQTRQAWLAAVSAQRSAEHAADRAEIAGISLEYTRRLHAAGNVSLLDLARQQRLAAEESLAAKQAVAMADAAWVRLLAQLGVSQSDDIPDLPATLPAPPDSPDLPTDVMAKSLEANLDLAMLAVMERRLRPQSRLATWPGAGDTSAGAAAEHDAEGWALGPTLGLELPLVPGRRAARRDLAAATGEEVLARRAATDAHIRAEIVVALAQLAAHRAAIASYHQDILPAAETVRSEAIKYGNAMFIGLDDVLAARAAAIAAQQAADQTLYAYWMQRDAITLLLAGYTVAEPLATRADSPARTVDTSSGGH